jgi:hypothetical protein
VGGGEGRDLPAAALGTLTPQVGPAQGGGLRSAAAGGRGGGGSQDAWEAQICHTCVATVKYSCRPRILRPAGELPTRV